MMVLSNVAPAFYVIPACAGMTYEAAGTTFLMEAAP